MGKVVYSFRFAETVPMAEVESGLLLAIWAAESLYGESQVHLDAGHAFDPERRICIVAADTSVGCDLNRLFLGFLQREFDADQFTVERVAEPRSPTPATTARD